MIGRVNNLISKVVSASLFVVIYLRLGLQETWNYTVGRLKRSRTRRADVEEIRAKWVALTSGRTIKLNLGGGPKNLREFINLDFTEHSGVFTQLVVDIRDLSFIDSESVHHIHTNHVIEHFPVDTIRSMFAQWHRILVSDGIVTIRCPNVLGALFGFMIKPKIEGGGEEFRALGFPRDEDISNPRDGWMHRDLFALLHWLYGERGSLGNQHHSLMTPTLLATLLEEAGFRIVKMSAPEEVNIVAVARKYQEMPHLGVMFQ